MKKTLIAAAALSIAAAPMAVAHADPSWTVTLNGHNVQTGNKVTCDVKPNGSLTQSGSKYLNGIYSSAAGPPNLSTASFQWGGNQAKNPDDVITVNIKESPTSLYNYVAYNGPGSGDAQLTKNGKTYKVTGHIMSNQSSPVPFEIDATCT